MKSMSKSGTTASFKYNENGLRIQKTVNGVVTNYTLHSKNIVHMTQGSNNLHFFYDASNKPAIVEYNGTKYAYVHNLQGDIVSILDNNGTAVVQYKYDAWGKPISKTGSMASTLGTVQPFRYRGYVYDEETGLYYLRSRYYNARQCRIINADVLYTDNLYSYCKNTPTVGIDEDGFAVVCCFDDNGFETPFMTQAMMGGCGGVGGSAVMAVSSMTEEERKTALVAVGIVGLSMAGSAGIMYGAHTLGAAFLTEATLVNSASNIAIGKFLYGATVANGIGLSYVWDDMVHGLFGKDTEPRTEAEFVKDFVKEFMPVDVPVPLEFIINYVQETEE